MRSYNENSLQDLDKIVEECGARLKDILDTNTNNFWAKNLGVTKSVVSARWKKNSFPNLPNVIGLLLLSGRSPNWALLGIGPKFLRDVYDPDIEKEELDNRQELMSDLLTLEDNLSKTQAKLAALREYIESHKQVEWLNEIIQAGLFEKSADEIAEHTGQSLLKHLLLPLFTVLQSVNFIGLKYIESLAKSENSAESLSTIAKAIQKNFDKNQFSIQSQLADLQELFEKLDSA